MARVEAGAPAQAHLPTIGAYSAISTSKAWYSAAMSKAFTKEPETGEVYDDLPDRPISPNNLVTPKGLELIEAELARLHQEHTAAADTDDRSLLAKINRDLRYWTSRRATAQVVERRATPSEVYFGSTVTIQRDDGRRRPIASSARTRPTLRSAPCLTCRPSPRL